MAAAVGDSRTSRGVAAAVVPKQQLRQQRRNQNPLHTRLLCTTPLLLWLADSPSPWRLVPLL
jgi:hypothetical protein